MRNRTLFRRRRHSDLARERVLVEERRLRVEPERRSSSPMPPEEARCGRSKLGEIENGSPSEGKSGGVDACVDGDDEALSTLSASHSLRTWSGPASVSEEASETFVEEVGLARLERKEKTPVVRPAASDA